MFKYAVFDIKVSKFSSKMSSYTHHKFYLDGPGQLGGVTPLTEGIIALCLSFQNRP